MSFYSYLHCWKDFNGMKKPGVAAPGFLFVLAVSFNYLSSLAKKSQEIFKFFIKIKKGALNKPCCFLYFNRY